MLIEWQVSLCMPSLFLVINQANSEVKLPISITNDKYFCYFKVSLSIESDVSTLAGHYFCKLVFIQKGLIFRQNTVLQSLI